MTGLLVAWALICGVALLLGVLADHTNFGTGPASAVKGRPYIPNNPGETR